MSMVTPDETMPAESAFLGALVWSGRLLGAPVSVPEARRFVRNHLQDHPLSDEVLDTALLLLSELATNAVLHSGAHLAVGVGLSEGVLHIAVWDGSLVEPSIRHYGQGAATGRGVALIDRTATRWGVKRRSDSKEVWFELDTTGDYSADAAPEVDWEAFLEGDDEMEIPLMAVPDRKVVTSEQPVKVAYTDIPVKLAQAALEYGDALARELTLVQFGNNEHENQVRSLDLTPLLNPVYRSRVQNEPSLDVTVEFQEGAEIVASHYLGHIDEANRMAWEGYVLTPPASAEAQACWEWILAQIIRQGRGEVAQPWSAPLIRDFQGKPTSPGGAESPEQENSQRGILIADENNYLVYVNPAAARLLRWEVEDLTGRRLTEIIPPKYRDAHLSGFTRHRVTGTVTIMDNVVYRPGLRRDGTELDLAILIQRVRFGDQDRCFQATIWDPNNET